MVEKLNVAIHQFAKRQMTWFRGMERKGAEIHVIDGQKSLCEKLDEIKDSVLRRHGNVSPVNFVGI
jgi:tRNA dimethylallyltransferase